MQEFQAELIPGLITGQRLIPCQTAGCYVPGGRYAHAASAVMSVGTAAVAGVGHIVAAKCPCGREHFVQHAAEGPDVGALVDRLGARLLRAKKKLLR